jgi:hypothetical protein
VIQVELALLLGGEIRPLVALPPFSPRIGTPLDPPVAPPTGTAAARGAAETASAAKPIGCLRVSHATGSAMTRPAPGIDLLALSEQATASSAIRCAPPSTQVGRS